MIFQCKTNVIIAAVYKPPNVSTKIFTENMEKILNIIHKENKYAYFLGDYNINTLNELLCKSSLTQDFINLMASYSYNKLICMPTRVINSSSSLLDNIYTNLPNVYETGQSGVLYCIRSTDHMPIFTVRNLVYTNIIEGDAFRNRRNFGNQNVSKFRKKLKAQNWNAVYTAENAQMAFTQFINIIRHTFDECCPNEKIKINYKNRHVWINKNMKSDIEKREKLFKLEIKEPTEENMALYKSFRNIVISRQRKAEREYFSEQYRTSLDEQNYRKAWDITKYLIGKPSQNTKKNIHLREFVINKKIITNNKIIADSFNEYFVNVGKSLAKHIVSNVDPMSYIVYSENAIQNVHTTVDDIKTIVSQLNNSAAGHNELPPSIMKQLCNEYCIPLSYIINSSIIQGDFPEELKLAKVFPIYKADNEQHIQNYRPISVLPFFFKNIRKDHL